MKQVTWTMGKAKLSDLEEYEKNPVELTERDARELAKSIKKYPQVLPYIAAAPKNGSKIPLLDGHQRKKVSIELLKMPLSTVVDVRFPSRKLTDKERQELIIRLRKNTGRFDNDGLLNWFDSDDLLDWGFEQKELEVIGFEFEDTSKDAEPEIDRAAELLKKWKCKLGQMWTIGNHVLLCGDSSIQDDVRKVMKGKKATLIMADPPYNVKYTGGSTNDRERSEIYQDDMSDEDYTNWLIVLLKNGYEFSDKESALLLWFASAKMRCVMDGFEGAGWEARTLIVWNKLKAHYGALGAQYKHKYEPMWYCFKPRYSPRFYGETNETTVWDFDQPRINELHPTMKPVEIYERCIRNHSEDKGIVLELFGGSGTTMVACNNLGRACRMIEKDPKYCAVILERLFTIGLTPVLSAQ